MQYLKLSRHTRMQKMFSLPLSLLVKERDKIIFIAFIIIKLKILNISALIASVIPKIISNDKA